MKLSNLLKEILSEWGYRVDNGLPNPKNPQHIRELAKVLDEMGYSEIKNEWITNILEGEQFKNPALNKVITYKDVNGEDAEGMVGNLIRRPKEEDAHQKAVASLGGEGSDTYKKAMNDLGGEGQPNRDIEKEKEKKGDPKGEKPQPVTAFDPNSEGGAEYLGELPDTDPAKPDSMKTDTSEVKQAKEVVKGLEGRTSVDGDELDAETTENGSILIGVEHGEGTQSTKKTIEQMKSLPKDAKVMFVGEGGVGKDDSGKIDFVGEQAEIRDAFLDHFENGVEESWDENGDVRNSDAPIFGEIAKVFDGDMNKALASVWTNMVGQGDDLAAEDYLTDETKAWIAGEAKKGGSKNFEGEVDWDNLSDEQKEDLYQLNFRDDANYGETELSKGQEAFNDYRQKELDRKIKEGEEQGYTVIATMGNSHVDLWRNRKSKEKADAEAKGGLDYLKGLSDTDPGKPDSMKNDTEKTQSDGGVVYSVGGGYYADSPGGAPKYRKATKEGIDTLDFRYILESEGEVVKKVAGGKGETVSMVVVGDGEKEKYKNTTEQIQKNKQKNKKYLNNTKGITSTQNINEIDGPNKENVLNGKEKVPGSPSSAVAEVGVGYGMACLSENEFDVKKADECLQNKLKETKLGEQFNTKELRRGALQGARRELIKVGKLIEEEGLNAETTTTGHVGGSKDSLSNTVKSLRDKGITEVNGIPIDEYEKIILEGGGGDNPTDTMVVVIDQSSGKSFIYHTSNKMTSADQISNGSPSKEIDEIGSIASENYDENQKKELETAQQETKDNIQKHRNDQKEYIRQQQTKMAEDANNPEIARKAIDRLKGVENPVSTSGDKYWKKLTGHKSVRDFAKEKGYDLKNLTPEQEVEVYQHYTNYMQSADPETERKDGGVGDDDIQIITRLYGVFGNPKRNQEELTTGNPPKPPVFDEDELNSFYDKQTDELNNLRERMNGIKEGSGDAAFSKRMKKRLHLDIAEGKNPGGIPNDKFETVMGQYAYKDLKQDSEGNLYEQDKKTKKYYLVNSDGSLGETPFDGELQDLDVAVVADPDTIKKCLGLNEGDSIEDGIEIRVDLYDNRKVIIYDKAGKQVGFQSARSKTGPGGPMQDTIAYHPDFQKCLATQTVLMGK